MIHHTYDFWLTTEPEPGWDPPTQPTEAELLDDELARLASEELDEALMVRGTSAPLRALMARTRKC
jgi:hypothetical protein